MYNCSNFMFYAIQIEDRLLIDYQILNKLTTPLRDVVNYEGRIRNNNINDLNLYQKVAWAWEQLNTSLEEIQKIVSKNKCDTIYYVFILAKQPSVNAATITSGFTQSRKPSIYQQ